MRQPVSRITPRITPYNWQHKYVYRDSSKPWDNLPISSNPVQFKVNEKFIEMFGAYAFEPNDKFYESALCSKQDMTQYDEVTCERFFDARTYNKMMYLIEVKLSNHEAFKAFSKNKMKIVQNRLLRLMRKRNGAVIYDAEVLLHRQGKFYAKHMRIRFDGSNIIMAKVLGCVSEHDVKLVNMQQNMESVYGLGYVNIYNDQYTPVDRFPNSYMKNDDMEPLFMPKNAEAYVKQFLKRNELQTRT